MRKSNARERILETAGRLFSRNGYALVGINEIIAQSETAKASFYQHFPSKEKLCAEWLKLTHERSVASHDAILKSKKAPQRKLRDYFNDLKKWLLENNFRGCPYTNTASMLNTEAPEIREQVEIHKLFIRDFFIELARGFTKPDRARQVGAALFLLYSGATAEAQNVRSTWPVESALETAESLIA